MDYVKRTAEDQTARLQSGYPRRLSEPYLVKCHVMSRHQCIKNKTDTTITDLYSPIEPACWGSLHCIEYVA